MFISKDFFEALNELERDKKINKEQFIEMLELGIASAYKKEYGEARNILITTNPEKAQIRIFAYKVVVETVEDPDKEISLEEAQEIKASYKIGDSVSEELTPKQDFSRVAVRAAKSIIAQRIAMQNAARIDAELSQKEHEIVSCIIRKVENDVVYAEIVGTQTEAVLLKNDQIKGENYAVGNTIKAYVKKVNPNQKMGAKVLLSRSNIGFVTRLFEIEVPEIKSNLIQIVKVVREAGIRTKIAVTAIDPTIDPVGCFVGQKFMRVGAVVQELNGEKIDIVNYSKDPVQFIARALSPATVRAVSIDEVTKSAIAIVDDSKFSLAIGKGGTNVKLASKLTEWKIDIKKFEDGMV